MAASDLLLVIDGSRTGRRVIDYAIRAAAHRRGVRVGVLCLLPHLPPELLEFGGAEDPGQEAELDAELKERQRRWTERAQAKARPALDRVGAALRSAGVPAGSIERRFTEAGVRPHPADALADEILDVARRRRYGTVVVGRGQETSTGEDLGSALAARATGVTLCLVK
jgi:nucleotide-binding universal stress UspA family protein